MIAQDSKVLCCAADFLKSVNKHPFWIILYKQIKLKRVLLVCESEEIRFLGDLLGHSLLKGSWLHFLILSCVSKEKEIHTLQETASLCSLSNSLLNFFPKLNLFHTILCNSTLTFMFTPNLQMFINRYHAYF